MRVVVQAAFAIRRRLLGMLRIRTRGVKVLLFNDSGELLLIRNSYGNRNLFVLPGGAVGRREAPEAAAAREIREELDVIVRMLTQFGTYVSGAEGKRDTIHVFSAKAEGAISPDPIELEEARYFALNALPQNISPATLRRVQEFSGQRPIDGRW